MPHLAYEKPEIVSWTLEQLDSVDPYEKSFESMSMYDHALNMLPSRTDSGQYWHIFTEEHEIADDEYWGPKITNMVRDSSKYVGEVLRGISGTSNQRVLLGYEDLLDDGRQLWAYVYKVSHVVQDAGINDEIASWSNDHGFITQREGTVRLVDLVYANMRTVLQNGANKLGDSWMRDDRWTTVGLYLIESERYITWADGASFDPSVFRVFCNRYRSMFSNSSPNASSTFGFVKEYLLSQEKLFNFDYKKGDRELLDAFESGTNEEQWSKWFESVSEGLVE